MSKVKEESALKSARLAAGLSIEDIAFTLNIRKKYLVALEEERYQEIPGKVYIKGYLKLYSEYLGVKIPEYHGGQPAVHKHRYDLTQRLISSRRLHKPIITKILLLSCAAILIISYSLYYFFIV